MSKEIASRILRAPGAPKLVMSTTNSESKSQLWTVYNAQEIMFFDCISRQRDPDSKRPNNVGGPYLTACDSRLLSTRNWQRVFRVRYLADEASAGTQSATANTDVDPTNHTEAATANFTPPVPSTGAAPQPFPIKCKRGRPPKPKY
ncbi:hypothetical protein D9756_002822 [Leucocoprinus leucothites]|uniref:Uncharacterized protein n=1 Tax=Leucocoprinus leucothites TaxID=201217 RepID=A0A8H5GBL4_9AGAR|nr:hypothetical protein D9756_002822 [Leucoagaricus leucothites]